MSVGIRQTLNEKPGLSIGIGAGLIVLAIILIIYEMSGSSGGGGAAAGVRQDFYSDDDGKTWFADEAEKVTPFKTDKGMAAKAYVFRCKDGKEFCGYLERYTPQGQKTFQQLKGQPGAARALGSQKQTLTEVKKPGAKAWVKYNPDTNSQAYYDVQTPICPDGSKDGIEQVMPGQK